MPTDDAENGDSAGLSPSEATTSIRRPPTGRSTSRSCSARSARRCAAPAPIRAPAGRPARSRRRPRRGRAALAGLRGPLAAPAARRPGRHRHAREGRPAQARCAGTSSRSPTTSARSTPRRCGWSTTCRRRSTGSSASSGRRAGRRSGRDASSPRRPAARFSAARPVTARSRATTELRCGGCGRAYPVVDGIPGLLDETVPGVAEKAREAEGWAAMARDAGLVRARRGGRRCAAVPHPRPRLGGPHLEGERALVRPAPRRARPGNARARGRRRQVLGRAARRRRRMHVRRHRHPCRPEHRARARRLLRAAGGPVSPRPGRRREPALRRRVLRRDVLRRHPSSRARPRAHGGRDGPRHAPRRARARAERGHARRVPVGRAPDQAEESQYGINEHVHTLYAYLWAFAPRGPRRAPRRAGGRLRRDGGPPHRRDAPPHPGRRQERRDLVHADVLRLPGRELRGPPAARRHHENRRLPAAGAVRARRRRDLHGPARRGAARARARGRPRVRAVQVVSRAHGCSRRRSSGGCSTSTRPTASRSTSWSRRSSRPISCATPTSASGSCTSSVRPTSSTERRSGSSATRPRTAPCAARSRRLDRVALGEASRLFAISGNVAGAARARRLGSPPRCSRTRRRRSTIAARATATSCSRSTGSTGRSGSTSCSRRRRATRSLEVVIAGEGPDRERLERLAHERGLNGRVRFTGQDRTRTSWPTCTRRCLAVYYAPVDEDYGMVPLEAFLSGKPVADDDRRGRPARGRVADGSTGVVVAPDAAEIARALGWLREHPDEAATYGRAGKAIAERGHLGSRDRQAARVRLAYFSPMPPEQSGIADYSALLLPALRERIDVDVVRARPEERRRAARTSRSITSGTTRTPTVDRRRAAPPPGRRRPPRLRPPSPRRRG